MIMYIRSSVRIFHMGLIFMVQPVPPAAAKLYSSFGVWWLVQLDSSDKNLYVWWL